MWPITIAIFRPVFGGSTKTTYLFLAYLFSFLAILLFYKFIKEHYDIKAAIIGLLALIFGPASFYYLSGFPYALFALLFMIYIFYLYKPPGKVREMVLAGTGLAMSLTYPTGILVAIIPFVWYLSEQRQNNAIWKNRVYWLKLAKYILPFVIGPLLLWFYFYLKFDDFFLQLHFQEKYNRTWAIPFVVIIKSLINNPIFSPENAVIIWFGLAFILFSGRRFKKELWITGLVLLLFSPSTGTMMSLYRHYLLIFPAYMMVGVASRPLWLKLFFIVFGIYLSLSLFFPEYISGQLI
jgi:4-amino-4-deoxy-L-arabinose transferase-like glycosyltransferase